LAVCPPEIDAVLTTPPCIAPPRHITSPDRERRVAHVGGSLAPWLQVAVRLLRRQGSLALIFRADGLADVLRLLSADFGSLAIVPVYPRPASPAIRVIVSAVKGARGPTPLRRALASKEDRVQAGHAGAVPRDGVPPPTAPFE